MNLSLSYIGGPLISEFEIFQMVPAGVMKL